MTGRSVRERAVETFASVLAEAAAAGDLGLARVAHRALADLLETPTPSEAVVDLSEARRRR